ncbi:hypothetical protein T265_01292 [Opisthorchis viverrini]|uniref:Uncharacterized protein n=1 Tax=Opisthorchis viverrini TaxID=6198 RepID=A0A075A2Y0_OPIVI|nr:hypothetical protein T265_01292 [Opisthorchis viverrini]KER32602.1 hypothetical protein T265_01292 [Opisthorchis viverrini]
MLLAHVPTGIRKKTWKTSGGKADDEKQLSKYAAIVYNLQPIFNMVIRRHDLDLNLTGFAVCYASYSIQVVTCSNETQTPRVRRTRNNVSDDASETFKKAHAFLLLQNTNTSWLDFPK